MLQQSACAPGSLLLILALAGSTAGAQAPPPAPATPAATPAKASACPPPTLQPLVEPVELKAQGGVLSTTFVVALQNHSCVPIADANGTFSMQPLTLRTYGFPATPGSSTLTWSTPGPTLRLRRATTATSNDGDRLRILLNNQLPPNPTTGNTCSPVCPAGTNCSATPQPKCCQAQETFPACFHGDNSTNLHFHGSHVSPQSPQDYVLLELQPPGTPKDDAHLHAHVRGTAAVSTFQYDVNPFPWNQAEGTHWYHPHKHGSVALQVLNGMAGALIIEGPFDDWLNGYYQPAGGLDEKVLVLQQVDDAINFFAQDPNYVVPATLVNGQANPQIIMQPGEVQRWRFVSATMQAAAQIEIGFTGSVAPQVKQIAMDGVQFSPANYALQPFLRPGAQSLRLAPGNRADLLVQAPSQPGTYFLNQTVFGNLEAGLRERTDRRDRGRVRALASERTLTLGAGVAATAPPLLTVVVQGASRGMGFPGADQWPAMPSFLSDISNREVNKNRSVAFSMTGAPGAQPNAFFINNKQFDPACVDLTMSLSNAEAWTVTNSSNPLHPFHMHTNPFQFLEEGTIINGTPTPFVKYDPPVWRDTIALPAVNSSWDVNAGPIWNNDDAKAKCPGVCQNASGGTWNNNWTTTVPGQMSVCGCSYQGDGYILFRSRFLDYTGEFVLHCHFLGHEDRGMMLGVQTVCPPGTPTAVFGTPVVNQPDNCQQTIPSSPQCPGSN